MRWLGAGGKAWLANGSISIPAAATVNSPRQVARCDFKIFIIEGASDCGSVPGIRISDELQFDIAHGFDEAVQALVRFVQQSVAGNDQFPAAVPRRAANEAVVRVLRPLQRAASAVKTGAEKRRAGHGTKCLVLANREDWLAQ